MCGDPVAPILRRQHGVISRVQALEAGLTQGRIRGHLRSGTWQRVGRGVYRHSAVPTTWRARVLGHCLGAGAVASHRTAAALHGLTEHPPGHIDITVAHGRRNDPPPDDLVVHQSTQTDRLEVVTVDAIPTTGLARTVLDAAAETSRRRLESMIDVALRERRLSLRELTDVLARHSRRGRNGCGSLRIVLDERLGSGSVPLSDWSRDVALLLQRHGLPEPELEHRILDLAGGLVAQVDLAYPAARLAIELDSVRWHLNREAFERDARRRNRIALAGWQLLSATWTMTVETPLMFCASVQSALHRRS